ncbi:uncharacterized protein LOC111077692 [Drosophila obscura]|uniref:uncharacterized protein LOC111077692 n=1 Tax=Drosophila obscura TaxID=7282 RepID=UPI001BB1CB50|nr:uncharacterized protein LOC111077692 [Drosophila obscura]XP_022227755.2 uncharacterized protein LOC111077692 [Drosophila obscura]
MTMASRQTMCLELRESQLAKLTNSFEEIRMRALEQVETRFIRCLLLDEKISVKPVFMLKQLIRWFGCKPLLAADRVLAILLELLRSEYAEEVVKKIPHERLSAELDKIKKIVRSLESRRAMELLDDLQQLLPDIYDIHVPPTPSPSSISQTVSTSETECSLKDQLESIFQPEDFEPAWTEPCKEDELTMKTMIDMEDSEAEMNEKLINLTIKMGDYPSEYFLQAPHIFFKLVKIQQRADANQLNANRVLIKYLLQMQSSIEVRRATLGYSCNTDPPATRRKQLRVDSALGFLLSSCTILLEPVLLQFTKQNWLILELITEAVRTYGALRAPVSYLFIERLSGLIKKVQKLCHSAAGKDVAQLVDMLAVPRLHSLICNGLLHDSIALNIVNDKSMIANQARLHLLPVTMDIAYLMCMPDRDLAINSQLCAVSAPTLLDKELRRLHLGYSMLITQLRATNKTSAENIVLAQCFICLVLDQLGSKTFVKELFDAVVRCNQLYGKNPKLRMHAEILIGNLMNLPDPELRGYFYNLMRHHCGLFFHAVAQKSVYLRGCTNMELIRQRIFGLPLDTKLLRQFVLQSWQDDAPEETRAWCLQYLDLLINLTNTLKADDFRGMYEFLQPVIIPLMICRSVTCSSLHNKLWQMACPDEGDVLLKLRTNVCYLFHPDTQIRIEAATRIAYILQYQDRRDKKQKMPKKRISTDFGLVQPPRLYQSIFPTSTDEPFQGERSLDALMRLLETKDLRPAIRKSTFTQLNVLLQNWKACGYFLKTKMALLMVMQSLHIALEHITSAEHVDNVLPALGVLIKIQFYNKEFLQESGRANEMYLIMTELLFETTQYPELRENVLICLFQMLCHEHMTASETKLVLNVDLSSLIIPITYELDLTEPPYAVREGLELEHMLQQAHFGQDAVWAAQYWRLKVAISICDTPENITLEAVQALDIRESLKLTAPDLALIQTSQVGPQLRRQLTAASNCSSHEELKEIVARIQTHLVLLRTAVPEDAGISLWNLMHRYLRVAPANAADREVYMSVSELCLSCMRFCVPHVWNGLNQALELDPHHSFLLLLHDRTIGLDMLQAICQIFVALLGTQTKIPANMSWHVKFFMQLSAVARTHFEVRQLLHVRCLLTVLHHLSERDLRLSEPQLMYYIRHFVQLSSDLMSPTQTGSQWQRDCLHIACHLHTRCMPTVTPTTVATANDKGHIANKIIAYLVGLCGHSDGQVRSLAWVSMANAISNSGPSVNKVLAPMDHPPGGLIECCLSTMLHVEEIMLVKEMAGRLFVMLMPQKDTEEIIEILRRHDFLEEAYFALGSLHDTPLLQMDTHGEQSSCGLIGCYIAICSLLVTHKPSWCAQLCGHRFMNCLSDVIKTSLPSKPYMEDFLELCAAISELYALCYSTNFEFLQRSICRDSALLQSFLTLLNTAIKDTKEPQRYLTRFIKLFLVFCKDTNAYEFLFGQLNTHTNVFIEIFLYATNLKQMGTPMQRHTLSALTMVCLKAQNAPENLNFVKKMDNFNLMISINAKEDMGKNEENNMNALNSQQKPMSSRADGSNVASSVAILVQKLYRLFDHYFPAKTFNFLQPPGTGHVQIGEALGALLKVSPSAIKAAQKLKLLDRVLGLLDTFVSDVDIGNASTYVKRVGAHKSRDILNNLLVLLNMLVRWHSSPQSAINDAAVAATFVRLQIRIWPWLSHSAHLKCLCVQLAMFLTEHSLEMCRHSSVVLSGQSTSLLQLMVRVADYETTRKETPNTVPHQCLVPALRVMINCCACGEARLSLSKMHVLDIFDTILPATVSAAHASKVSPAALIAWLGFWEVYSRYDVGSKICHLHGLITAIQRMPPLSQGRILCLRILRNMSFSQGNRLSLVGNADFMSMLSAVVSQPVKDVGGDGDGDGSLESYEEHSLVVLILWKLYCFVAKYQAILRGTKLMKKLSGLQERLSVVKDERPELFQQLSHAPELEELLGKVIDCMEK